MHPQIKKIPLITTVQEKEQFKSELKERILEGHLNPLEFYRQARLVSDCIDELKKDSDIMDCAFTEIDKYGKEKAVIGGSTIGASSRTTYDYASCNDSVYNDLKEKIKAREQYLKNLPPEGAVSPETGELILPPKSITTNFITIKI